MSLHVPVVRQLARAVAGLRLTFLIFRKLLCVGPELTDGHIKIVANRGHDITRAVGETAFYPSQIIGAIAKGRS